MDQFSSRFVSTFVETFYACILTLSIVHPDFYMLVDGIYSDFMC